MMPEGLHKKVMGHGRDIVMLHGWSMHSGIWGDFAARLAEDHRVTCLDLPGHGHSPMNGDFSLARVCAALLDQAPPRASWIGWSLGASFALQVAAMEPSRVTKLVLIAGTPKFVSGGGWARGMDVGTLDDMIASLTAQYEPMWKRFLLLLTLYSDHQSEMLRDLRDRLKGPSPCDVRALRGGLEILRDTDLRPAMMELPQPVLVVLGGRDPLVPKEAGASMSSLNPAIRVRIIETAGHMPFISNAGETAEEILRFLADGGLASRDP